MAEGSFTEQYSGLIFLGVIVLLVVGMIIRKELKKKKPKKNSHEIQLPEDIDLKDIENVEFFKTPEKANMREVTTDALKMISAKRNVIKESIIKDRKRMLEELKKVKQTQIEIYQMLQLLIGYYKDLKKKEQILKVSTAGLMQDE